MGSEIKTSQESELAERLEKIENKLDLISNGSNAYGLNANMSRLDEIDLQELWSILWQGKWWVIGITFLFAVAGVFYALSLPNIYQSSAKLAPADGEEGGQLAGLGGLASIAGVSLGGEGEKIQFAVELIGSRLIAKDLMSRNNLKPKVLAVLGWDKKTQVLRYDPDLYDENSKRWVRQVELPVDVVPSFEEFYDVFRADLDIVVDKKTGFISVSYVHQSPVLAQKVVIDIIHLVNERMRQRDIENAQASIEYLEGQLSETSLSEVKSALFKLIEEQVKTKMLANVHKQYVLQEIDPAYLPEKKYGPSRSIICFVFVFIGGFLSTCFVIGRVIFKRFQSRMKV